MHDLKNPRLFREKSFINGEWRSARSGETMSVDNPATGETLGAVPAMSSDEAAEAVGAATEAFADWKKVPAQERSEILRRWHELMMENQEDLARLMTLEQGKPLAESRAEVAYGASFIRWFSGEAERTYGEVIPAKAADQRIVVIRQPVGPTAAITPWNFPIAMITRKAGAALAAGCTMVARPASQTPFSALALGELAEQAGIPAGVFNVITGPSSDIGKVFTTDPRIRKFTFTGSTKVGKMLMEQCASTMKKVSMELGGNAPFIVFDDADLDAAVEGVIASKFRNMGQTCICANRIFVHDTVYEEFTEKLCEAVAELKVGNGLDDDVQQGPLIDDDAMEKVEEHVRDAVEKGASIRLGGKRHELGGRFFQPSVLTDCGPGMKFMEEETFGPIAPLVRFSSEEDAIKMANDTPVGLAGYFYSRDLARTWRVAEALETGMVGINTGAISNAAAPFGGVKESGLGREGSRHGISEFLEIKYLCLGEIS